MQHFDAQAVRNRLPFDTLVPALRERFAAGCAVPPRHVHALGEGASLLLMPAWRPGGRLGVKAVTVCPGNGARGLPTVQAGYTLFDGTTGTPLAQIDGSELTARRTAAVSALAAQFLARADARRLVVAGAGRVAALLPEALRSVRPGIDTIEVWSRRPEAARALAATWQAQGLPATACADLESAVRRADIVSCATLASAPLIRGDWLAAGTHLDLVGSFTPTMREADGACLKRARVFVDTEEALLKSGDLLSAISEGCFATDQLQGTLAQLCRGERAARASSTEISLFKSVGTALADLAAAERLFDGPGPNEARSAS